MHTEAIPETIDPPPSTDGSGAMFDRLAPRYDLLNRLMSFGMDGRWRRQLVQALQLKPHHKVCDVATGTADVALAIVKRHPHTKVIGIDPSVKMLDVGRAKVVRRGAEKKITLMEADAQAMPFAANTFDAVCISFGIRNVPDRLQGLREMGRICKPGRPVVVLELGEPKDGMLAPLAQFHVHTVAPWLGAKLSRAPEYRYLQRSIAAFPAPKQFAALMTQAGLTSVTFRRLSFGALHLYVGHAPA